MDPLLLTRILWQEDLKALLVTGFLYEVTTELNQLPLVSPEKTKVKSDIKVNVLSSKVHVRYPVKIS